MGELFISSFHSTKNQMFKNKSIIAVIIAIAILEKVNARNSTVKIQTSAVCDQCKDRIENDLSFEKGVKSSHLDQKTKVVTVVYNPAKADEQKIRGAITKMGYDADSLKADLKAYEKLPKCCKFEEKK